MRLRSFAPRLAHRRSSRPVLAVDLQKGCVYVEGQEVGLTAKELLALAALHAKSGNLCSKDELARHVWPEFEGAVDDESIEQVISRLRRKIEPDQQHPRYLLTARGLGYRLLSAELRGGAPNLLPAISVALRPGLLIVALAVAVVVAVLAWRSFPGSDTVTMSLPAETPGWVMTADDDFSDPEKTAFPKGSGSTTAGLIFARGPDGGEYVIRVLKGPERTGLTAVGPPTSLESFAFEADARASGSVQYGLVLFWGSADALQLRLNPSTGDYELFLSPEGTLAKQEGSFAVLQGSAANHLRFEVNGQQITVLINGTVVTTVTVGSAGRRPVSPGFHIFVAPGQEIAETSGTRAFFDNFRLFAFSDR